MKAIKIIFVFILILGGVIGAFLIIRGGGGIFITPIEDNELQTYREQFESDWENANDWNEEIFKSHCELINMLSSTYDYDIIPLKDLNTSTAVEIVYKKIFDRWSKENCKKDEIDRYIKAISTIENVDENARSNENVTKITDVNRTYVEAYNLAYRKIGLSVRFDGTTWNSYYAYAARIRNEKDAILNNNNYSTYLSNIAEIKSGLNAIQTKLSNAEARFYSSLAQEIQSHFSNIERMERNREQLNELRNIVSKYNQEYTSNSELSKYTSHFAADVYDNENRKDSIQNAQNNEY